MALPPEPGKATKTGLVVEPPPRRNRLTSTTAACEASPVTTSTAKPIVSKPSPADVATAAALTARKRPPTTADGLAKLLWPGRMYLASAICAVLDALSALGLAPAWLKPQPQTVAVKLASTERRQNRPRKVRPAREPYPSGLNQAKPGKVAKQRGPADAATRAGDGTAQSCRYCAEPAQCLDAVRLHGEECEIPACLDCRRIARKAGDRQWGTRKAFVRRAIKAAHEAHHHAATQAAALEALTDKAPLPLRSRAL